MNTNNFTRNQEIKLYIKHIENVNNCTIQNQTKFRNPENNKQCIEVKIKKFNELIYNTQNEIDKLLIENKVQLYNAKQKDDPIFYIKKNLTKLYGKESSWGDNVTVDSSKIAKFLIEIVERLNKVENKEKSTKNQDALLAKISCQEVTRNIKNRLQKSIETINTNASLNKYFEIR